jgi:hypothetical protein
MDFTVREIKTLERIVSIEAILFLYRGFRGLMKGFHGFPDAHGLQEQGLKSRCHLNL